MTSAADGSRHLDVEPKGPSFRTAAFGGFVWATIVLGAVLGSGLSAWALNRITNDDTEDPAPPDDIEAPPEEEPAAVFRTHSKHYGAAPVRLGSVRVGCFHDGSTP